MAKRIASQGKCIFCGSLFSKTSMTRHLNKHLEEKVPAGKKGHSFLIKIESAPGWGSPDYFLNMWIDGNTTLQKIDSFLRQIWLECCGHLSAFRFPRQRPSPMNFMKPFALGNPLMELGEFGEIPMNKKVKDVLHQDLKLEYEYDFGSTTTLRLTVLAVYEIAADQPLILLSRNEPLPLLCELCGEKPATEMCSVCAGSTEAMFCAGCAKKHAKTCIDFADYAAMPIVNSPRAGVCAYNGGTIDTERDGVFVKQGS
jgi:hypothetical protein